MSDVGGFYKELRIAMKVIAIPLTFGLVTVLAMVGIVSTQRSDVTPARSTPPDTGSRVKQVAELEGSFRVYAVHDTYLVYVLTDQDGRPIAITR